MVVGLVVESDSVRLVIRLRVRGTMSSSRILVAAVVTLVVAAFIAAAISEPKLLQHGLSQRQGPAMAASSVEAPVIRPAAVVSMGAIVVAVTLVVATLVTVVVSIVAMVVATFVAPSVIVIVTVVLMLLLILRLVVVIVVPTMIVVVVSAVIVATLLLLLPVVVASLPGVVSLHVVVSLHAVRIVPHVNVLSHVGSSELILADVVATRTLRFHRPAAMLVVVVALRLHRPAPVLVVVVAILLVHVPWWRLLPPVKELVHGNQVVMVEVIERPGILVVIPSHPRSGSVLENWDQWWYEAGAAEIGRAHV